MIKKLSIRGVSLFLSILLLLPFLLLNAYAADGKPSTDNVDAVCVANVEYRKIVIDKNLDKTIYPASTVKLMTALVAYDYFKDDLDQNVTITKEMISASVGRNMALKNGEIISVRDLLYALLCGGYNDAATILAFTVSGGVDAFCDIMNKKAHSLGANDTNYKNPTGLHHDEMVTTAFDTALIAIEFFENETLLEISKKVKHIIDATNFSGERTIYNRNALITTASTEDYYYSYSEGMNSGATDEAGDCVVTAGRLDGLSYVCVVMGGKIDDSETNYAYKVAKNNLRYALINYSVIKLKSKKTVISSLPVQFSAVTDSVDVVMSKDLSSLLYSGVDIKKEVEFVTEFSYDSLDAPFDEGKKIGTIKAYYKGNLLDEADLITTDGVDSHGFLIFMYKMRKITANPVFIIFLILSIGGGAYYFLKIKKKPITRKRRKKYYF